MCSGDEANLHQRGMRSKQWGTLWYLELQVSIYLAEETHSCSLCVP